ncbi:MAG: PilZ domain-containing protein [Candidatus Korobacteraceae bacterium]|jgi:hypothetical protein
MEDVSTSEKRAIRRFSLQLPVIVNAVSESGATVQTTAETRDVSSNGICFYCDAAMERRSEIEFTVTLPAEVTMTEPLKVLCHGTVVRVEQGDGKFTIAAAIESYEFVVNDEKQKIVAAGDVLPTL